MARKVTRKEYLEWMALESRTHKWDAYFACDRDLCNWLLLQEYIESFDAEKYMLPIDDQYLTGETTWTAVIGLLNDSPRLSFENNPDGSGGNVAEANMSMAVVGGASIDLFSNASGQSEVVSIKSYDPLDFPELKANRVLLKDIAGQVDANGKIVLDLGDSQTQRYIWELTGSRIQHVRRMGGAFMKRKFREAEPARRTFVLGELAPSGQDHLKTEKFKLRTVMEEGANVRSATNFGNGALEVRMAMRGSLEGGFPGEDWLYPFQSDFPQENASLIISHDLLLRKIIAGDISRQFSAGKGTFTPVESDSGYLRLGANSDFADGHILVPALHISNAANAVANRVIAVDIEKFKLGLHDNPVDRLLVTMVDGLIHVLIGHNRRDLPMVGHLEGGDHIPDIDLLLKVSNYYSVYVTPDAHELAVSDADVKVAGAVYANREVEEDYIIQKFLYDHDRLWDELDEHLKKLMNSLFNFEDIHAFLLYSLLFNRTDAVQLSTAYLPRDLLASGTLSPRLTTFKIDPPEKLLGYGDTFTFTTLPLKTVKFSVSNLNGTTEGAGCIDENSGQYTAPALDEINGTFKRVKITATGGGSDGKAHISRAMVTIAARAITLNPLVVSCPASGSQQQTREFSANSMNGVLRWSVVGKGSIADTANPDRTNIYTAPPVDTTLVDQTFTIDKVEVINTTTQQKQSSYVVVTHGNQTLNIAVEYGGIPSGQAQFSALFNGKPAPELVWSCIPETGAGKIDPSGRFTAEVNSKYQFVIIKAWSAIAEYDLFIGDAFFILPFPLGPLPPQPDPEVPQGSDGMPQV